MKSIEEFLSELRRLQIELWIDRGRLRYGAPQGTMRPDLLEQMRSRKSEILAFFQQINSDTPAPIKPVARDKNLPLSFAQERLWFLDQLEGKNAAYNMAMALRFKGNLNLSALEQALKSLIERHEVLRTNFATCNGIPITLVRTTSNFSLPLVNLQNLSEVEQQAKVQQFVNKERLQPFNLENDSLIQGTLLQLQKKEHILLLTLHHIISDGWSMNLLRRELGIFYLAHTHKQENAIALPELPIQYIDFAYWQRERFAGEVLQQQLSYWKQQLDGAPPLLALPTDHPRPTIQTFNGAKQSQHLSQTLIETLKTLSQREGVTLFMTLLAAFKVLLSRYTGTQDIVVGSPVAGRNRNEVESLIGFFINTVVLRTHWDGNPSFRELLAKVKQVTLGAYEHQETPFEKLVEELQPERTLSYNPLFQVWFNSINLESQALDLPGLTVELFSSPEAPAKFDLTLYVREQPEGIKLEWVYNQDLFNPETITWMTGHFQTLLEAIVAAPEQPIANLSLLSETERQRLRNCKNPVCPNQPFTEFPKAAIEQSIPARFEEQVRKYPHQIAIHSKNHQWSYSSLNHKANAIAQTLLKLCPDASERIALLLEHDAPAIAAILGVLKTGKTYVPLDPTYPQLRLSYILADSQATAIVINHNSLAIAQELTSGTIQLINLDEIDLKSSWNEVHSPVPPDTLAYILYTSGSTGQPKGVIQNHRNILHFIRNYTNNLHIAADDKLTLLSSYSFDAAVMDIFGALLNGATLYPIDIKIEGLIHLADWVKQQEITIYHSIPTLYRHFLETLPVPNKSSEILFPTIRLVILGGEEVIKKDIHFYRKYFLPNCIFVNGLGCTESSFNLQYLINQQTVIAGQLVPVGYPFEETEILLLTKEGINTEVYGEIAIKSLYLALGYWQKPQLTQAVFLPDLEVGNRRIYRTGDLGRLRADGTIEFLGRKDLQVKIRGFRIELGDIEANLAQHPAIRETVVIAFPEMSGGRHLVAYVVLNPKSAPTALELRHFLKDRLPNYMVPATFVILDALPLTPNGKINRRALPDPDSTRQEPADIVVAPRDELELQLTKIWGKVLNVEPIHVSDNFFELGGHSLLAVQLFSQIKDRLGKDIPVATLFQAPTVEELASIIRQEGWSNPWSSLVPIKPGGSKSPFFFHGGAADATTWANFGDRLPQDQPFYGLQHPILEGRPIFQNSIEEMAAYCLKEIQTLQPNGPYFIGGHCFGGTVAFEIAQQLHAQGENVALLVLVDAYPPKPLPKDDLLWRTQAFFYQVNFLLYKTYYYHIDNLKQRNLSGKLTYIQDWLLKKVQSKLRQKLGHKLLRSKPSNLEDSNPFAASPKIQNSNHSPTHNEFVAHEVRYLQAEKANRAAKAEYIPQVYPGRITLFRASKQGLEWYFGSQLGWEDLAAEEVESYQVPGFFGNLFNQSSLPFLVEKVKMVLEETQVNPKKNSSL